MKAVYRLAVALFCLLFGGLTLIGDTDIEANSVVPNNMALRRGVYLGAAFISTAVGYVLYQFQYRPLVRRRHLKDVEAEVNQMLAKRNKDSATNGNESIT